MSGNIKPLLMEQSLCGQEIRLILVHNSPDAASFDKHSGGTLIYWLWKESGQLADGAGSGDGDDQITSCV